MLARETGLSLLAIQIIFKKYSFCKIKPIKKFRLTLAIKAEWYEFALAHRNQILENWKAVIWMDKISIVLDHC